MRRKAQPAMEAHPPDGDWKELDDLQGVIESQFVHRVRLGESVMPYSQRTPAEAVLPLTKGRMMHDDEIEDYDGLRRWWERPANYKTSTARAASPWISPSTTTAS